LPRVTSSPTLLMGHMMTAQESTLPLRLLQPQPPMQPLPSPQPGQSPFALINIDNAEHMRKSSDADIAYVDSPSAATAAAYAAAAVAAAREVTVRFDGPNAEAIPRLPPLYELHEEGRVEKGLAWMEQEAWLESLSFRAIAFDADSHYLRSLGQSHAKPTFSPLRRGRRCRAML
jgi:hypothetical protein